MFTFHIFQTVKVGQDCLRSSSPAKRGAHLTHTRPALHRLVFTEAPCRAAGPSPEIGPFCSSPTIALFCFGHHINVLSCPLPSTQLFESKFSSPFDFFCFKSVFNNWLNMPFYTQLYDFLSIPTSLTSTQSTYIHKVAKFSRTK